ncbi:hypothetical protein H735_19070 [Vibrio owensii CAIM 1854 = LMG 25443]|uniref:Uncharacterized protein n=1 Tax=Vibrio owensii CAIM 1854 = LMG 25443 TaxID=1229493 RepID=A0A0C1ZEM6_9VIBR|nr:hypothetical protein H735_19070 [Vibrio owensii CAIM 1854 = LMG 25443]
MKSRDLKTIYDVIVTEYKMEHIGEGRFLHSFKPKTTKGLRMKPPMVITGARNMRGASLVLLFQRMLFMPTWSKSVILKCLV